MRFRIRALHRFAENSAGAIAVEAALVLPVLFAMSFAVIEAGRAMWMQNALQDAVDAAARCGVVSANCATSSQIQSYAVSQIQGFSVSSSNFTVSDETCGMHVSASVPFTAQVAGLRTISINLIADSCRPVSS